MKAHIPVRGVNGGGEAPIGNPVVAYLDREAAAAVCHEVDTSFFDYADILEVNIEPDPLELIDELIDELDQRTEVGWIGEGRLQAQHDILVKLRKKLTS